MSVLIDKINNYFKLSREISTLENSVSTKKQELERKYSIEYYKLKNELTNYLSNIRPTYEKVCSLYKTTPSMIENQMRLSVKSFMSKVTPINACEVAKKAGGESINFLSAAIKQINVSNFKEFAVRYYTVIEILSSIENLQSQAVSLELEFYQAKIDSLKSELQSICRDKNEFKCLARQAINAFQFRSDKIHMLRVLYEQDSQELLNDAMDLKEEILEEHKKVCQNMLSSEANMQFDGSYRFLVGFYQKEIAKEDLEFATTVLGIPEDIVKQEPIWFNYTSKHDTILIKAPSSFIESNYYNEFIRNLYFSFVSHLPARNMLFCGIECNTMESVVGGLEQKIRNQLGGSYIIHDMAERSNDITAHNGVLDALRGHANDNSRQQNGESIKDIFEYNEKFTDNPQKFAFFCVSNYPEGFNNATASAMQDMRRLLNGGSKGIISIICETTDGKYNDYAPILTPEELNADCIEFTSNGKMLYNGIPAVSKITTSEFNPDNYWFNLDKYFKSSASIYLEKLLDSADKETNKPRPIAIPIGNSDGGLFHLELTECTVNLNGLIIGNIGSGKTAFLHTLILSAAYTYSPADLQFYLVDFKNKIGSTDFAPYRKQEGVKNLYIPHVRYLMLKGKAESAFELLDKIESMSEERAAL